jgi:hypothetical protein
MKIPSRRLLLAAVGLALLPGSVAARAETTPPAVTLAPDMSAEEILKLLGQPTEKNPIPNTDGKGERWVYRQRVTPAVKPAKTETYQVLTLLMINGKLVIARQTSEEKPVAGK